MDLSDNNADKKISDQEEKKSTSGDVSSGEASEGCSDPSLIEISRDQYDALLSEMSFLKDQYMRAQADLENVRRRSNEELTRVRLLGMERFLRDLLPIYDALEMALVVEDQSLDTFRHGVEMTRNQFQKFFSDVHLVEVNPIHEKFDPNLHQAISTEVSKECEPDHVIRVLQKGYLLHDRLIRAALVTVSAS